MNEIKGFKNVNILINDKIIKTNIIIKNGIIDKLGCYECDNMITLSDELIIVPGFIDEHIHGSNGYDFSDEEIDFSVILNNLAKDGVTSVVSTISTNSIKKIENALVKINEYIKCNEPLGSKIIGIHLEGPFISKEYKGAQLEEYIINPDIDLMKHFIKISGNHILLVTTEINDIKYLELIKYLKEHHITSSVGHSCATYNDTLKAINYGLSSVTHTFNALKPIHHHDLGACGAALLCDDLYTELICDGVHLSKEAVGLLVKNKPIDKIVLITDALRQKGLKDGIYIEKDQTIVLKNNSARLIDGTLAGSTLSMYQAIKNMINFTNVSFSTAIKFATENPAKNLGLFKQIGSIEEGKVADLVIIDKDINVYYTIRNGKIIYKKGEIND